MYVDIVGSNYVRNTLGIALDTLEHLGNQLGQQWTKVKGINVDAMETLGNQFGHHVNPFGHFGNHFELLVESFRTPWESLLTSGLRHRHLVESLLASGLRHRHLVESL